MTLTSIIQRRFDCPFKGGQVGSEWPATMRRNMHPTGLLFFTISAFCSQERAIKI